MNQPGDDFLAGAGLAGDQNREIGRGEAHRDAQQLDHPRRPEHRVVAVLDQRPWPQVLFVVFALGVGGPIDRGLRHVRQALQEGDLFDRVRVAVSREPVDAIVLNPPRRGLSPSARSAAVRLRPRAIAYVSCNPDTFARDLDHFVRLGFAAAQVAPVDMIPLSDEIESCAILLPTRPPPPAILYEDERLLAIDKPAHEPTTPQGEHEGSLLRRVQELPEAQRAVPIHRLDVETSGVCLVVSAYRYRRRQDFRPLPKCCSQSRSFRT